MQTRTSHQLLILFLFFFIASCSLPMDRTGEAIPTPEEPGAGTGAAEAALPSWHEPGRAFKLTSDSLVVTAAAVAADSADARAIAGLALNEAMMLGITAIIHQMLEDMGQDAIGDGDAPEGLRRELLRLLTLGPDDFQDIHPGSQKTFWHRENGQVRCYLRHGYDRADLAGVVGSF